MYFSGFSFSLYYTFQWMLTEAYLETGRTSTTKLFFGKILNGYKLLTIFAKKAPSQIFHWVENRLVASSQGFKLRKYSAGKYVWHRFWEDEASWWDRTSFYPEAASEGFFKKGFMRNFAKFLRKHLCQKNETLAKVFSCEFCEIYKNFFFAENYRTTASDYSSINSNEGRINKRNGKLWYKN